MQWAVRISAFVLIALGASAQPFINYRGVVNAASFTPSGLIGSEIAQGSVFSIFGRELGPTALAQANRFPLPTTLAGVSVKVIQGGTSVDAFPLVVTASQLNVIMPSNAPLGRVSIRVTYNGDTSNSTAATVVAISFGIFAANSGGYGPGILQNFVAQDRQPLNSLVQTAAPGQVITLWGTGLGPVTADNVAPTPGDLSTPIEIFVGGKHASKLYGGRSPCCSGVDQIVFKVPDDVPQGCYVPVQIRVAGTILSNAVTMAVQAGGGSCSDPGNPIASLFAKGGKVGLAILLRNMLRTDVDASQPADISADMALITLRSAPGGALVFNAAASTPPLGTCTMYSVTGRTMTLNIPDFAGGLGNELDAGPAIAISGTSQVSLSRGLLAPLYAGYLGDDDPFYGASTLVFNTTGATTVSAPGGADVGAFQVAIPSAVQVNWTNRLQIGTVDRSRPLTVTWSPDGLQNVTMIIAGSNYDLVSNATRSFACTATPAAGTFVIPSYILGALSPSRARVGQSFGALVLAAVPFQELTAFTASGLNAGLALQVFSSAKTVLFR
jgi:uncharacterized protein (TIGR03437 family)